VRYSRVYKRPACMCVCADGRCLLGAILTSFTFFTCECKQRHGIRQVTEMRRTRHVHLKPVEHLVVMEILKCCA
jgi:hypothetical protein